MFGQYTKMTIAVHLKNKIRFVSPNFKLRIPLNCTNGATLRQDGILKKQNTDKTE